MSVKFKPSELTEASPTSFSLTSPVEPGAVVEIVNTDVVYCGSLWVVDRVREDGWVVLVGSRFRYSLKDLKVIKPGESRERRRFKKGDRVRIINGTHIEYKPWKDLVDTSWDADYAYSRLHRVGGVYTLGSSYRDDLWGIIGNDGKCCRRVWPDCWFVHAD